MQQGWQVGSLTIMLWTERTEATFQFGKLQDKNLTGNAPLQQPNLSCRGLPCPNAWFCANHMPCIQL